MAFFIFKNDTEGGIVMAFGERIKCAVKKVFSKQVYSAVAFALTVVMLFGATTATVAWFADNFRSGNIGFSAGSLEGSVLEIAKVPAGFDTEEARDYTVCSDLKIEYDSLPEDGGDLYRIVLDELSFGMIDNVAMLKPENTVYFRLSVPKANGNNTKFRLAYLDESFIQVYKNIYETDQNGEEIVLGQEEITDEDLLKSIRGIEESLGMCYVDYSVKLSDVAYNAEDLWRLEFDEHSKLNSDEYFTFENVDIESEDDYYYIYIKVEPNLSVLSHAIEYLSHIMPCYVYFRIEAEFDTY